MLMCYHTLSLSVVVFLFLSSIVGGDEVVGLGLLFWWVLFLFLFLFLFPIVGGDEVVGFGLGL